MGALGPLHEYFRAEKNAGFLCLALGLVALAFAGWLWRVGGPFRTMFVPVLLVALLQVGIGGVLAMRTGRQVSQLVAGLESSPGAVRAAELARMNKVNASFRLVEVAEVVLILGGLALALALRTRPAVMAVGMGLLLQATVMLVFDLFAERRAHTYSAWLQTLSR